MPVLGGVSGGSSGITPSIVDAKGDLIVGTANDTVARKGVGATGKILAANSAQSDGLEWIDGVALATSGQTPAQEPVAPGAVNTGALAYAARADHVHASAGLYALFGSGADGDFVLNGTNDYGGVSRSGSVYRVTSSLRKVLMARNVTISSGVTLVLSGDLLFVSGTLTNNGTIRSELGNQTTSTYVTPSDVPMWPGGIGYRMLPSPLAGVSGGTGAGAQGSADASGALRTLGGSSGAGGSASGGATAGGGARTVGTDSLATLQALLNVPQFGTTGIFVMVQSNSSGAPEMHPLRGGPGGGAGAGDGTNSGGASGHGGGIVLVNASAINGAGSFSAPGGAGGPGAGGAAGGGGGGGGGVCVVNTVDSSGWTGTVSAPGGAGGAGVGTGTSGSAGESGYATVIVRS